MHLNLNSELHASKLDFKIAFCGDVGRRSIWRSLESGAKNFKRSNSCKSRRSERGGGYNPLMFRNPEFFFN